MMVKFVRLSRRLAIAAAILGLGSVLVQKPAQALDAGTAVGIGLGSFALGTALGTAANPYNNPHYYNGYYPAPVYSYPAPATPYYYPPRSCWDPYYRRYYAC
jgi:hypothetical protein